MLRIALMILFCLVSNVVRAENGKIVTVPNGDKSHFFNIPGIGEVKNFPVQKFEKVKLGKGETKRITTFKSAKDRNYLKIIFLEKPNLNGVFLLDSSGNTLSSVSKNLMTEYGYETTTYCREAASADFNNDGKKDYFVNIAGIGNGIAQTYNGILFLSDGKEYKAVSFTTFDVGCRDFVDLFNNGKCFLIVANPIQSSKLNLPPGDFGELPKDVDKEELKRIRRGDPSPIFMELYFYVYYPLEIKGTKLVIANNIDKRFPVFKSWFKWSESGSGSKGETSLLSSKQKQKIWMSNKETIMDFPLRDKVFEMPK